MDARCSSLRRASLHMLAAQMAVCLSVFGASPAYADNLFVSGGFAPLAGDQRASRIGDIVTVVVVQSAEASSTLQNGSRRSNEVGGGIAVGGISERADISFGGSYSGRGEARRTERFVTQISVSVSDVLPNGDLVVGGQQNLRINGENSSVVVRGRVRIADIDADNRVASDKLRRTRFCFKKCAAWFAQPYL
jgi:flagellar L-ring protein FlgH